MGADCNAENGWSFHDGTNEWQASTETPESEWADPESEWADPETWPSPAPPDDDWNSPASPEEVWQTSLEDQSGT